MPTKPEQVALVIHPIYSDDPVIARAIKALPGRLREPGAVNVIVFRFGDEPMFPVATIEPGKTPGTVGVYFLGSDWCQVPVDDESAMLSSMITCINSITSLASPASISQAMHCLGDEAEAENGELQNEFDRLILYRETPRSQMMCAAGLLWPKAKSLFDDIWLEINKDNLLKPYGNMSTSSVNKIKRRMGIPLEKPPRPRRDRKTTADL